jgi:hypothetical protein
MTGEEAVAETGDLVSDFFSHASITLPGCRPYFMHGLPKT